MYTDSGIHKCVRVVRVLLCVHYHILKHIEVSMFQTQHMYTFSCAYIGAYVYRYMCIYIYTYK